MQIFLRIFVAQLRIQSKQSKSIPSNKHPSHFLIQSFNIRHILIIHELTKRRRNVLYSAGRATPGCRRGLWSPNFLCIKKKKEEQMEQITNNWAVTTAKWYMYYNLPKIYFNGTSRSRSEKSVALIHPSQTNESKHIFTEELHNILKLLQKVQAFSGKDTYFYMTSNNMRHIRLHRARNLYKN